MLLPWQLPWMAIIPRLLQTSNKMLDISIKLKSAGSGLSHELYTTNDEIVGEVVIIATDDIHVDDLDISFIGK